MKEKKVMVYMGEGWEVENKNLPTLVRTNEKHVLTHSVAIDD